MQNQEKQYVLQATDVDYLDRNGLSKLLRTLNVGSFWDEVMEYRKRHCKPFPWALVNLTPVSLTRTPTIEGKLADLDESLRQFVGKLGRTLNESERREARKSFYLPILKEVCSWERIDASELSLKAMLNGTYSEDRPDHRSALLYRDSLDHYAETSPVPPTDDFLGELLTSLSGGEELVSFYREGKDFQAYAISSDDKAPAGSIESYMTPFLEWLTDERERHTALLKAIAILFYLPHISPFEDRNNQVAALLAKDVLALSYGKEAYFLPIEALLSKRDEEGEKARRNVRSTGDLTYFVFYALKRLARLLPEWEELLKGAKIAVYSPEYDHLSDAERAAARVGALNQPLPPKAEQLTFDSFPLGEEAEEPIIEPSPRLEERPVPYIPPKEAPEEGPIKEADGPLPEEEPAAIEEESKPKEGKNVLAPAGILTPEALSEARMGYGEEPDYLTEKEVREYIRYLLETNPSLNKKQASFLATHRTEGRYYTIQQFKRYARCVYETARTSMDKLAREGYYTKLQVKNRFVYTPKKRR